MEKNSLLGQSWTRGKCIGQGAFGKVNVGVRNSDGGVFAVKSIDLGACRQTQADALENEIRILRSLSSPYIVKYFGDDFTHAPPRRNFHMEYMKGGTVADVAEKDESVVRRLTWCVTSALSYLHSRGVVHCDVKGRNVLVGSTTGVAAKLADFGSAVDLRNEGDTCKERIVPRGSPLWMAPEVIRGEYQGPESDVWSLGCTMIEMLTGKPPWEDEGLHTTIRRVGFSGELPEFPTRLSESGRDFLDKCLRVDPESRWSCDQLLRHSFLASVAQQRTATHNLNYASPRCVLDWVKSEFEEDKETRSCISHEASSSSAKERIGELATNAGADWEFEEGWTVVRGCVVTEELALGAFSREETTSEYSDCGGVFSGDEIVECERDTVGPSGCWYGPSVVEDESSVGKRRSKYYSKKRTLLSFTFGLEVNDLRSCKMWCICCYVLYFLGDIIKSKYYSIFRVGLDHNPKYILTKPELSVRLNLSCLCNCFKSSIYWKS